MNIGYISADFGVPVFGFKGASIHLREMVNAFRKDGHNVHIASSAVHAGKGDEKNSNMGETGFNTIPPAARALFDLSHDQQRAEQREGDVEFLSVLTNPAHLNLFKELDQWDKFRGQKSRVKQELRNLLYNLTLFDAALACFSEKKIDFIYERYSLFSLAGIRVARALKIPHVLEVNAPLAYEQQKMRGLEMKELARATEKEIFLETDRVFVVSRELKDFVVSCGVAGKHIEVLPNSVDPARFCEKLDGAALRAKYNIGQKCVIGFVGSLKAWHGTDTLLQAFASLHKSHPDTHLLIVGDGPTRDDLEIYAQEKGITDSVTFTGKVPYQDIPDHIAAMDITVAPYIPNENFYFSPIKIFEYMAMGKPVVAGRIGQVKEIVINDENGKLFTPGNVVEMEYALAELAGDELKRQKMGGQGKAWVFAERTWARNAQKVLSIVDDLKR